MGWNSFAVRRRGIPKERPGRFARSDLIVAELSKSADVVGRAWLQTRNLQKKQTKKAAKTADWQADGMPSDYAKFMPKRCPQYAA
jgi:hypothetical protein